MYKILIIEDEIKIAVELKNLLTSYDYECFILEDFNNPKNEIIKISPSIILLDINLPVYDGYHILRNIRKDMDVPVIIVTSRDTDMDELMGMNLGADDFITKPYNHNILLARISNLLKRTYEKNAYNVLQYKSLILNISTSSITFENNEIELTKNESKILEHLMNRKGKIVSRNDLIEQLWESEEFIDDNTLTVNINRLRKKIESIGAKDYIITKRGQGYLV